MKRNLRYFVQREGIFTCLPYEEGNFELDWKEVALWRAVLDKALSDFLFGKKELHREVSVWIEPNRNDRLYDGNFAVVCDLGNLNPMFCIDVFDDLMGELKQNKTTHVSVN